MEDTADRSQVPRTVPVGPFAIADQAPDEIRSRITRSIGQRVTVMALHVGGLNERSDADFVKAMNEATFVYADGIAVVLLARIAGASEVQRTPTTDLGWEVIGDLAERLGRRVRVGIIGSDADTLRDAVTKLEAGSRATVVHATDGYQASYTSALAGLRDASPDLVFVGLGMPLEAKWVVSHLAELPSAIIMTCGGWLGFVAGTEARAPRWMQRIGLEWVARLYQAPRRLLPRYVSGMASFLVLIVSQTVFRLRRLGRP